MHYHSIYINHIETSYLVCRANQSTGFSVMETLILILLELGSLGPTKFRGGHFCPRTISLDRVMLETGNLVQW